MAVELSIDGKLKKSAIVPYQLQFELEADGVTVQAANDNDTWNLVKFKTDGTIYLNDYIDSTSGFKVTKEGKLTVSKDEYVK